MDWEGFLRRVFQRLDRDIDPASPAIHQALTRAMEEAQKVAVQASFEKQLLRSGVLCVASYLPDSWSSGPRFRVAIALLDEAGCRAFQGQYKRFEETDWCLTSDVPTEGIDLRDPANRYKGKQDLHGRIRDYILVLERKRYLVEGEECAVFARVADGDYRAYTTFAAKRRNINFQSLPGVERARVCALVPQGEVKPPMPVAMEELDISASQLKIALALRGLYLPIDLDVWTALAQAIQHPARENVTPAEWRDVVKRIALAHVLGDTRIAIPRLWKNVTNKSPKQGLTTGLKSKVGQTLLCQFPLLAVPLRLSSTTPDGVPIHGFKAGKKTSARGAIRRPDGQPQKINTSYDLRFFNKEPDVWNVLVAHEAWLIRETIFSLPPHLPVLPVHDQLYFHEGFGEKVASRMNALLKRLAEGNY